MRAGVMNAELGLVEAIIVCGQTISMPGKWMDPVLQPGQKKPITWEITVSSFVFLLLSFFIPLLFSLSVSVFNSSVF